MLKSVKLASQARERFCAERPDMRSADIKIALSLGPFGATLSPTQEYGGFYPPPYGPHAYSSSDENRNIFLDADEGSCDSDAEEALMEFHFERLALFANAKDETWTLIDCLAFETIPLLREVRSIKRAVGRLNEQFGEAALKKAKPWWISLVFPDGMYPEMSYTNEKGRITPQEAAQAVLEEAEGSAVPNGIGLNCTSMEYLPELLVAFEVTSLKMQHHGLPRPWLVLYPNRGDAYDSFNKIWRESGTKDTWGDSLARIVKNLSTEAWAGILVGGCCRVSPREIEMLTKILRPGELAG
jgi:homocysteine S-methyltransferase